MAESGIKAGKAFVELGIGDKLTAGLDKAQTKLKHFGESVASVGEKLAKLGAGLAGPLLGAAKVYGDMGEHMEVMSKRTGVSVEALSELSFVAEQSGVEMGSLEKGLTKMGKALYSAINKGADAPTAALRDLGLSVADLKGLKPDEQFYKIADALSGVQDETTRAGIAMQLFGKGGHELLPLIEQGSAGMDKLRARARELGLTMSGSDAAGGAEFEHRLKEIWASSKMVVFQLGGALAPAITEFTESVLKSIPKIKAWISDHKELLTNVMKLGAVLIAVGTPIAILGKAIGGLSSLFSVAISGVKLLITSFTFLMAHPVVAIIAAITAGFIALHYALDKSNQHLEETTNLLSELEQKGNARTEQTNSDYKRFGTLKEILSKEKLSNDEQARANEIAKELEGRYGNIGIIWDKISGNVKGLGANSEKGLVGAINNQQLDAIAQERLRLKQQRDKHQSNIDKELDTDGSGGSSFWYRNFGRAFVSSTGVVDRESESISKIDERLELLRKQEASIKSGNSLAAEKAKVESVALSNAKTAAEIEELKLKTQYRGYDLQVAMWQLEKKRAIEAAKAAGEDLKQVEEEFDLKRQLIQLAQEEEAAKEQEKECAEQYKKTEEERAKAEELDKKNTEDIGKLKLQSVLKGYELEKAMLQLDKEKALEEAKAVGANLDLVEKEYELKNNILDAEEAAKKTKDTKLESVGSFNTASLQGIFGSKTDRMVQGIETIAQNTDPRNARVLAFS